MLKEFKRRDESGRIVEHYFLDEYGCCHDVYNNYKYTKTYSEQDIIIYNHGVKHGIRKRIFNFMFIHIINYKNSVRNGIQIKFKYK